MVQKLVVKDNVQAKQQISAVACDGDHPVYLSVVNVINDDMMTSRLIAGGSAQLAESSTPDGQRSITRSSRHQCQLRGRQEGDRE